MMLHTEYQGSRPWGVRLEENLNGSPYINLCKTCDPWGGAIFSHRGKLGRGQLGDATYKISRF